MAAKDLRYGELPETQTVIVAQGADTIVIADASLLYGADFMREGPDLVLRNDGADDIRIVDYFRTAEPADLQSPDGGTLRGHVVERLAGPEAPGQYAQAGAASASVPIGQVETVAGTASVQRADGTTEPLVSASRIFLNDVVQTVGDSALSITFADGTIFTLSADSRMVIDELIYSPNGNGNSATFNLVQGGFIFIAGQVAKTGGMEVNTPAATMGIRGTTVLADVQTQGGVSTVEVTLTRDPDGSIGRVELFDLTGNLITTITGIDTKWIVSTEEDQTREVERTADDEAADNVLIADAVAAYRLAQDRFAQEGSFIRLDSLLRDDGENGEENGAEDGIDLDSQDADDIPEIDNAPAPEDRGNDSFDEGRFTPPLRTPIDVVDSNLAPIAFNVAFSATRGRSIEGTLFATDPDGDTLTFSLGAAKPAHGTLVLQGDGSFIYTPNAGYAGLDGFDFVVTDSAGAAVSARVTLSVETGTIDVPGGSQVSVSIYPDPDVGPAGQIVATSTNPDTTNVNLVFALDRSGSIGAKDWNMQINAVVDALATLAAQFDGAATQVDVNIIAYSSNARTIGPFDLADPDLIPSILGIRLPGGGTNWANALASAESIFDSQPAGELNYLYFISDGKPSNAPWRDVLARLTDVEAKGYSVQIEAFGIGPSVNQKNLQELDSNPVLLSGPEDLLAAIEASPLFAPKLVDLSVRLIADGVDKGEIADETAPGISVDGFDTKLALADIAGLAELLGEENIISVTVGFDLDGDASTSEIELFTSQVFARQVQAITLDGTNESDLLLGSDYADILAGNGGNDIIFGFGGDDLIFTGAGLNQIFAGAGNDRIVLESAEAPSGGFRNVIDGGAGRDVLAVAFGGNLTDVLPLIDLRGIEAIDMTNGQPNSLELTLQDVMGFSDEPDTELEALLGAALPESLTVYGDASDTLTLANGPEGGFVDTGASVTDAAGTTLNIYTYVDGGEVLATLAVDSDVAVTVATVA